MEVQITMQCSAVTHEMVHFRTEARTCISYSCSRSPSISPLPLLSLPLPLFSSLLIAFVIGHRVPYIHPSHTALRTADGGRTTVDRACSGQAQTRPGHRIISYRPAAALASYRTRTAMSDADSASRLRGIIFQGCVENYFQPMSFRPCMY